MGFKPTVEIPLFLALFAYYLTDNVNTNLLIYRTCYIILGFDKHNCSLLGNIADNATTDLEKAVQPRAAVISMVKNSVDSVSTALLCLFVAALSDRFGRKPFLIINLIGSTLIMLTMVVFAAIDTASPWYMLTYSIPVMFTGGRATLTTVILAYATDITSEQYRGLKIMMFDGILGVAVLCGSVSSSFILNATSYIVVFLLAALSCFLGLLYTIFFVPESLENKETTGFFETQNISSLFATTFKKRPQYKRVIILLIMFSLALYFVTVAGDASVIFMFTRAKFHWTLKQYTLYDSITNVILILGTGFIVSRVHIKLKVKESKIIFAGFICGMTAMILQGLAQADWLMFVVSVIKTPAASVSPMAKSLISKSVNGDEMAKIFSVFIVLQNLLGLVGSPVYTMLYNATLHTNPGIFNFVSAGEHAVNALCLLVILMLQQKAVNDHLTLEESSPENEEDPTPTIRDSQ